VGRSLFGQRDLIANRRSVALQWLCPMLHQDVLGGITRLDGPGTRRSSKTDKDNRTSTGCYHVLGQLRLTLMAPQNNKLPTSIKPMLGRLVRSPFDSPKHLFELKWDGMRGLAFVEGGELRLLSRNGRDITSQFPELGEIVKQVKDDGVLLDGEIVCLDEQNRPSFSRLQQRLQSKRVARPRINPAHFIAFDILYVKGKSVMKQPLMDRKNLLNEVLNPTELIQACEFVEDEGEPFFQATCDLGLEGSWLRTSPALTFRGSEAQHGRR